MKPLMQLAVGLLVLSFSATLWGQSLAEVAKKEKERREKNEAEGKGAVVEADEHTLRTAQGDTVSVTGKERSQSDAGTRARRATDESETPGRLDPLAPARVEWRGPNAKRTRAQCRADLQKAEEDKKRFEDQFRRGAAQRVVVDTTKPKAPVNDTTITVPPTVRDGRVIDADGKPAGATVIVESARVPCSVALASRSKYPDEAGECADIQAQMDRADEARQAALRCLRSS